MADPQPEISIVVPVYGSEKILPELVAQVYGAMQAAGAQERFELILVSDSSPDRSWEVIRELAPRHAFLRGICLAKNFGQHNAIMAGLNSAAGEIVVVMDDDLQHPPAAIMLLVQAVRDGADVCFTTYTQRKHAAWKRFGSWVNDVAASFLLGKPRGLYLSSFKAMHRRVAQEIVRYDGPYAYVDGLILDVTRHVTSVPITHQERHEGKGNYGLRRSLSLWLKMATSFSIIPLRLASFTGIVLAGLSALAMVAVIAQKLRHPEIQAGWASMLSAVLFMGGLQLLCLGVIGEYLGRTYLKINRKPQFVVRQRIEGGATNEQRTNAA